MGSGIVVPGRGFLLNNFGNIDSPNFLVPGVALRSAALPPDNQSLGAHRSPYKSNHFSFEVPVLFYPIFYLF
jgi:hypothetical protein